MLHSSTFANAMMMSAVLPLLFGCAVEVNVCIHTPKAEVPQALQSLSAVRAEGAAVDLA